MLFFLLCSCLARNCAAKALNQNSTTQEPCFSVHLHRRIYITFYDWIIEAVISQPSRKHYFTKNIPEYVPIFVCFLLQELNFQSIWEIKQSNLFEERFLQMSLQACTRCSPAVSAAGEHHKTQ